MIPIFFEPDWVMSRYQGWKEIFRTDSTCALEASRGPAIKTLILSRHASIESLESDLLNIPVRRFHASNFRRQIILHDLAGVLDGESLQVRGRKFSRIQKPRDCLLNRATFVFDLNESDELLRSKMSRSTRERINRAEKRGYQVSIHRSPSADRLDLFFERYSILARRENLQTPLRDQIEKMLADQRVLFLTCEDPEGKTQSILLLYKAGLWGYFLHGTRVAEEDPLASRYIHWKGLQHLRESGMRWYDFGGVDPEFQSRPKPDGIAEFKRGFGGEFKKWGYEFEATSPLLHWTLPLFRTCRKQIKSWTTSSRVS